MEDEEFYMWCVMNGLESNTESLQILFRSLWEKEFPGTNLDFVSLKHKIPERSLNRKDIYDANFNQWDISKLAYVMVDADLFNLKKGHGNLTVAIVDNKILRNEVYHTTPIKCTRKEFEDSFFHLQSLGTALESKEFKKYFDSKHTPTAKVDKICRKDKPIFGDKLRKMKNEYKSMKYDIIRYQVREDYEKEKSKIECKVHELQGKLSELHEKHRVHTTEKCEMERRIHKLNIENEYLKDVRKSELTEKTDLNRKLNLNKKQKMTLHFKLYQKKIELLSERRMKKNLKNKLKQEKAKTKSLIERVILVTIETGTKEKRTLEATNRSLGDDNRILQAENHILRTENHSLTEKNSSLAEENHSLMTANKRLAIEKRKGNLKENNKQA